MYYVMITVTILFMGKIDVAIRHYLFLQADGHYWTITQEMFFYLLLPVVMMANFLLCRNSRLGSMLFFTLTVYCAHNYITGNLISLYGNNAHMRPLAGIFFIGVLMAFTYNWLLASFAPFFNRVIVRKFCSAIGLLILLICMLGAAQKIPNLQDIDALSKSGWFGMGAGLFILFTLLARGSFLDRLMCFGPLRAVGLVGYSFYLLHPMMISCVRATTVYFADYYLVGITLFIISGIATYLISIFTYSYIERPFIKG